jgi:ribonuclease E
MTSPTRHESAPRWKGASALDRWLVRTTGGSIGRSTPSLEITMAAAKKKTAKKSARKSSAKKAGAKKGGARKKAAKKGAKKAARKSTKK